ncbi:MAG: carbohydrate ABC transporter substrate-binding protein, partial [bacterium]|nr:carbohydrate ABC transporter substrate-binding protein [bacterium]
MGHHVQRLLGAAVGCVLIGSAAQGAECEVVHWWTSPGESAAVKVLADSFDGLGDDTWVDGAIEGSGGVARPIIADRVKSDSPPCAAQFNTGKDADDLIAAGLMQDLTDLATEEGWADIIRPKSQFENCVKDGKVYCVPVNLHSGQWMWVNRKVYQDLGLTPPRNWGEVILYAPKLREAGIKPLAIAEGSISLLLTRNLVPGIGGPDLYTKIYQDKDAAAAGGEEMKKVLEAMDQARQLVNQDEIVDMWNDAVAEVIAGEAGAV